MADTSAPKSRVENFVGSWPFIIGYGVFCFGWAMYQWYLGPHAFDHYPYILLNLILSFLAGEIGPLILLGQNQQKKFHAKQEAVQQQMLATILHLVESHRELLKETAQDLDEVIEKLDIEGES